MTAQAFQEALEQPDDDVSNQQLCQLIERRDFGGTELPNIATDYLQEFSNSNLSTSRRRWIGLALVGMIDADASVSNSFEAKPHELEKLGEVVLDADEPEEMRIMSGLIMRQLIEQGVDFDVFWASEKVLDSSLQFPEEFTHGWFNDYQDFLDILAELQLLSPANDPCVIYPVSMVASDDMRWTNPGDSHLLSIIEGGMLTTIVPDLTLQDVRFIEVPLHHIDDVTTRPASLFDSQGRKNIHAPWDVVVSLQHESWTYRLDVEDHSAEEFSLMFRSRQDAQECAIAIEEFKQASVQISSKKASQSAQHKQRSRTIMIQHSRQTRSSNRQGDQERSSSLRLVDTPVTSHSASKPATASQRVSKDKENRDPDRADEPPSDTSGHQSREAARKAAQKSDSRYSKTELTVDNSPKNESLSRRTRLGSLSHQQSDASGGKLAKVSQNAKLQLFRKATDGSHALAEDDFSLDGATDLDEEIVRPSVAEIRKGKKNVRSDPTAKRTKTPKNIDQESEDHEYVPAASETAKKTTRKRKSAAVTTKSEQLPRKKAKAAVANAGKSKTRTSKQRSPSVPPQATLIGGLKQTNAAPPQETPFKKPAIPIGSNKTPATPLQKRNEKATQPKTPTNRDNSSRAPGTSVSSSSSVQDTFLVGTGKFRRISSGNGTLSSNSKPVPASPNAESTAISGHADHEELDMESAAGDLQRKRNDPFSGPSLRRAPSALHRRLTGEGSIEEGVPHDDPVPYSGHRATASAHDTGPLESNSQPPENATRRSRFGATPVREGVSMQQSPILINKNNTLMASKGRGDSNDNQTVAHEVVDDENEVDAAPSSPTTRASGAKSRSIISHRQISRPPRSRYATPTMPNDDGVSPQRSIQNAPTEAVDETQEGLETALQENGDLDDETTLVELPGSEDLPKHAPAGPIYFASSPPAFGSPGGSSTSAESDHEPRTEPQVPSSEAEEMEWEASLKPHQRDLHDVMLRVSRRVLRHIVDNETAVTSIAEEFAADSKTLLTNVIKKHETEHKKLWGDMQGKKKVLKKELSSAAKELAEKRKRISEL